MPSSADGRPEALPHSFFSVPQLLWSKFIYPNEVRVCPRFVSTPEATYKDLKAMLGKTIYVGEAVAAVVAESG